MKKQLHPAVKISWRISRYITAIFFTIFLLVGIGTYVLELLDSSGVTSFSGAVKAFTFMFLFIFIIFVVITEIWVRLLYNRWFYEFTSSSLKLERGVIIKRYSDVPYERIQNVDIRRGIIARIFGFSSVIIHTAGYSGGVGGEGNIPAVDIQEAEKIREFLINKISKHHSSGL